MFCVTIDFVLERLLCVVCDAHHTPEDQKTFVEWMKNGERTWIFLDIYLYSEAKNIKHAMRDVLKSLCSVIQLCMLCAKKPHVNSSCSCYSLSSNSLPAAAEAGQCCQEEQQEKRDADAQNQTQNKVRCYSIHLLFLWIKKKSEQSGF